MMYRDRFLDVDHAPDPQPVSTRLRLAQAKHKEEVTLYSHLHGLEPHIESVNKQRLHDVMRAEQIRLARGERPGRLATATTNIRSVVGLMLISAGERIRQEPVTSGSIDSVMNA